MGSLPPPNQLLISLIAAILGGGGLTAIYQILAFIRNRKKIGPETDEIVTSGAKNAVETIQITLHESRLENQDLRNQLVTERKRYETEINRLNLEIRRLTDQATYAQEIIDKLQVDLRTLKESISQNQQSSQHHA